MYRLKKEAFTLVELIVVITILAILGTIGFLSLQGYAQSARESTRLADLNTISKALELYRTTQSFYPDPTDVFTVSYTGAVAWQQGVFGEATRSKTERISQVPLDPLTKNPYAYSLTNTKQEYELGAISESLFSQNTSVLSTQTYAANSYYSMIKGNYNKKIVSVKFPGVIYILGVPTIITSEINDVTVQQILANQSFSVQGSKSLPSSYATSLPVGQTLQDGDTFTPGTMTGTTAPLIYEGQITDFADNSIKQIFGENIVSYYKDSNIGTQEAYDDINTISTCDLGRSNYRLCRQ